MASVCWLVVTSVYAVPATYTITGIGTGALGDEVFSLSPFSIVAEADTDDIGTIPGIFSVPNTRTTATIDGIGSAEFNSTIRTSSNQAFSRAGFGDFGGPGNFAILFVDNNLFASYDLGTSIGPLGGPVLLVNSVGQPTGTTAGDFYLTSVQDALFTAVVVPEPNSFLLISALFVGLGAAGRRRITMK